METADRERPATMSTHLSVLDSGAFSPTSQEIDFNNTQLRLVREQTSHCIKDLNALRAEVMLVKSEVESDRLSASAAASSMEGKQIEVQEHFERERRDRDVLLQQLSKKVQELDRELPSVRDEILLVREQMLGVSVKGLGGKLGAGDQEVTVESRLKFLERALGDSEAKHREELERAHGKLEALHGRLGHLEVKGEAVAELKQKYEKQGSDLEDLRSSHADLRRTSKTTLDSHHSTLKERLDYLESMMGDSADNHNKVMQLQKSDSAKLSQELRAHQANHATLADRMGYLEKLMGDSFEKHAKELAAAMAKMDAMHGTVSEERLAREAHVASLESLKKAHGTLASDKQALEMHLKERMDQLEKEGHATLADRIGYIEQVMGDSFEKHAQELAAAKAKMDVMRRRVSEDRVEKEAHVATLESLQKAHGSLASQKQALEKHHATLQERIDYLEKALGDSSEKHMRELEALKAAHHKVLAEHKGKEQSLLQMQREKDDLHTHHMSLRERVDYLEKLLGESAEKHQQELEKFKAKHEKLDAGANKLQSHHSGLQERLEYLESKIGDSADQHAKELGNMQAKMRELHGKLQDEKNSQEEKFLHLTGHLREQVSAHKTRDEKHASMEERLEFLETLIGDNAEKHIKGIEEHGKGVNVLHEKHDRLEKMLGASADKHAQEEAARLQVEDLLKRETQERLKHHQTQSELVDSLQRSVGIFDALIRKEMEQRELEMKHIWEAIDRHTHDLDSKVKARGSDVEDEDETRLRPHAVARSSPSLPGVVSPSVRSGGGNSPKVVTYRPVLSEPQARIVSYPSTVVQAPAPAAYAPAPFALQNNRSELIAAPGRSLSPPRRVDHSEVVCGKARYNGERAHNAEIFLMP